MYQTIQDYIDLYSISELRFNLFMNKQCRHIPHAYTYYFSVPITHSILYKMNQMTNIVEYQILTHNRNNKH